VPGVVQILNDKIDRNIQADIFVRSHIHEYDLVERRLMTVLTTPGLQFKGGDKNGLSSTYGRKCTGFYDYGFISYDIDSRQKYALQKHFLDIPSGNKQELIKL